MGVAVALAIGIRGFARLHCCVLDGMLEPSSSSVYTVGFSAPSEGLARPFTKLQDADTA